MIIILIIILKIIILRIRKIYTNNSSNNSSNNSNNNNNYNNNIIVVIMIKKKRELGLDRLETGQFYPTGLRLLTVYPLSTRGTGAKCIVFSMVLIFSYSQYYYFQNYYQYYYHISVFWLNISFRRLLTVYPLSTRGTGAKGIVFSMVLVFSCVRKSLLQEIYESI